LTSLRIKNITIYKKNAENIVDNMLMNINSKDFITIEYTNEKIDKSNRKRAMVNTVFPVIGSIRYYQGLIH